MNIYSCVSKVSKLSVYRKEIYANPSGTAEVSLLMPHQRIYKLHTPPAREGLHWLSHSNMQNTVASIQPGRPPARKSPQPQQEVLTPVK